MIISEEKIKIGYHFLELSEISRNLEFLEFLNISGSTSLLRLGFGSLKLVVVVYCTL